MTKNIIISNNANQELAEVLANNNNVMAEKVSDGMLLMPVVEEATWLPVFVQPSKEDDYLLVTIDKPDDDRSLWEKVLNDDLDDADTWKLDKERLLALCQKDDQAVFKIVELLDIFSMEPGKLLTVLEVLSRTYSLDRVLQNLLNLTRAEADKLFATEAAINILSVYRELCL